MPGAYFTKHLAYQKAFCTPRKNVGYYFELRLKIELFSAIAFFLDAEDSAEEVAEIGPEFNKSTDACFAFIVA